MSTVQWPRNVLLNYDGAEFGGDFDGSFVAGLEEHGCEVTALGHGQPWLPTFDLLLGYGPFTLETGSMLTVSRQILALPVEQRPIFVWWLTEGMPDPRFPSWFVTLASKSRVSADRLLAKGSTLPRPRWRDLLLTGHRLRIIGELDWMRERGLPDVLVVTCPSRAQYLQKRGFRPIVVPLGYHGPSYGSDLGLERDIEVAFLGNTSSRRRQQILPRLFDELTKRSIQVAVENNLYGEARSVFINRSRILLNILRAPQDFVGQRFLLGAANKALIISEPVSDIAPFVPGQHLVVADLHELADAVQYYLSHESEWQEITDRAYRLVTEELTITKEVGHILEQARSARDSKVMP